MEETWLYHYDLETKRHLIEWRHSGSPRPKNFRIQKSSGKFLVRIFWDQDGMLLIDYLPKGQTINAEYYSSLLVQLKDILEEKRRGEVTKGISGHLQPRRNWPTCTPTVLITHPILRIWPLRTTTVPWSEKTIEISPFFVRRRGHSCHGKLVGWKTVFFFEWLAKVRATG